MNAGIIKVWLKKILRHKTASKAASELPPADHIEITRQQTIGSIVSALVPLGGHSGIRSMVLWAHDAIVYHTLASQDAMEELKTALDNAELQELSCCDIQVRQGKPEGVAFTPILKDKLDLTFSREDDAGIYGSMKCKLSMVKGTGSMVKDPYILDTSGNKRRYKIGRGEIVSRSGFYRENDIVIKEDDSNSEISKNNKHVSSNHADIVVDKGRFYLQAMNGGCSNLNGSATKILRRGREKKLGDIFTLHPLEDGDVIELGRKVRIKVHIEAHSGKVEN